MVTLDRPEARNAVDHRMATELEAALDRFEADPALRCAILAATTTGDRPVFSSGQDLKSFGRPEGLAMTERNGFAGITCRVRAKPIVAAVDGLATAGGFEMGSPMRTSSSPAPGRPVLRPSCVGQGHGPGGWWPAPPDPRRCRSSEAMRVALRPSPYERIDAERRWSLVIGQLVEPPSGSVKRPRPTGGDRRPELPAPTRPPAGRLGGAGDGPHRRRTGRSDQARFRMWGQRALDRLMKSPRSGSRAGGPSDRPLSCHPDGPVGEACLSLKR